MLYVRDTCLLGEPTLLRPGVFVAHSMETPRGRVSENTDLDGTETRRDGKRG